MFQEARKNKICIQIEDRIQLKQLLLYMEEKYEWLMNDTTKPTLTDDFMGMNDLFYVTFGDGAKIYKFSKPVGYIMVKYPHFERAMGVKKWISDSIMEGKQTKIPY